MVVKVVKVVKLLTTFSKVAWLLRLLRLLNWFNTNNLLQGCMVVKVAWLLGLGELITPLAEIATSFSRLSRLFRFGGLGVRSHYFCIDAGARFSPGFP